MRPKTRPQGIIFFFTSFMLAAEIRAQCNKPSVGGNRILTTDNRNFPEGSTAEFRCSVGFEPVDRTASKLITCKGEQWTDLQLECKKKSCAILGDIPNGKYLYNEGKEFGSRVTAECNKGFTLVGNVIRNCQAEGWDGREPICEVVKCSKPPEINNGYVNEELKEEEYEYNEAVTFSCIDGYILNGTGRMLCSADGTFQPITLHCFKVACDDPNIQNGIRIEGKAPPYGYKQYVRYKCNSGYRMVGNDQLTCEATGWDSPAPKCICDGCLGPPTPPSNGNGLKLGFGLGIPILLVLIGIAVYYFRNRVYGKHRSVKVSTTEDVEN